VEIVSNTVVSPSLPSLKKIRRGNYDLVTACFYAVADAFTVFHKLLFGGESQALEPRSEHGV
jgi:hypothetical protein